MILGKMPRNQHLTIQDEFCLKNFSPGWLQLFRKIEWLENWKIFAT